MYLPKDREVESALWPVWVNPIFRSSLSTFWSSLGGFSTLRFRSLYLHFPLSPIPALFHHVSLQFLGFSNPVALFYPLLNEEDAEGSVRPCPHPSLSFPSCGNNPSARISTDFLSPRTEPDPSHPWDLLWDSVGKGTPGRVLFLCHPVLLEFPVGNRGENFISLTLWLWNLWKRTRRHDANRPLGLGLGSLS